MFRKDKEGWLALFRKPTNTLKNQTQKQYRSKVMKGKKGDRK